MADRVEPWHTWTWSDRRWVCTACGLVGADTDPHREPCRWCGERPGPVCDGCREYDRERGRGE